MTGKHPKEILSYFKGVKEGWSQYDHFPEISNLVEELNNAYNKLLKRVNEKPIVADYRTLRKNILEKAIELKSKIEEIIKNLKK